MQEIKAVQEDRHEFRELQDDGHYRELRVLQQIRWHQQQQPLRARRRPNVHQVHGDAMRDMSDSEFKWHFWFDKPTVARLAALLDLGWITTVGSLGFQSSSCAQH